MGYGCVAFLNSPLICYSCRLVFQNTEKFDVSVFFRYFCIFGILNTDIGIISIGISTQDYCVLLYKRRTHVSVYVDKDRMR